jgi:GNAT superfamily N-acetyltransferase
MAPVLNDLSPAALAAAIEANLYAFTPFSHRWPGAEVHDGPDICWCVTDIPFPSCNAVFRARLSPEKADGVIESIIERCRAKNLPTQWWTAASNRPTDLGKRLAAHGFTTRGDGAGMAIDLLAMNEGLPPPDGLTIGEVEDATGLGTWCHIAGNAFGIPEHAWPDMVRWFARDMEFGQPARFYLGYLDGEPVASSMVSFGAGVAGLYFVGTLLEARNRGIGFAITRHPLLVARELGYRVGILQASKMGEPVYSRMGFEEYCRIASYSWSPKTE